jgi:hypothetical protein
MRQIHICAWLFLMSLTAAACSGEKFTASEQSSAGSVATSDTSSAGSSNRNQAGSSHSTGGAAQPGTGGTSTTAGTSNKAGAGGSNASGGTSTGGTSSSGGHDNAGGDASEDCPSGTITFRMLPGPDLARDYLCDAGCGTGWLTITDAQGAMAFSIFSACGTASCESCQMTPCAAAACLPTPLTATGSELMWTGTYLAKDTCGANMACQRQACVKPGKYKAKACAAINAGASPTGIACTPKNEQLCAEAEFDFPATTTVKLVLKK